MAVSDYLMPAVAELGRWTRAHLVELPGFAGSGEPTRQLDVPGYAGAVVEWLDVAGPGRCAGRDSSGTQVAARAAVQAGARRVVGAALASHRRSGGPAVAADAELASRRPSRAARPHRLAPAGVAPGRPARTDPPGSGAPARPDRGRRPRSERPAAGAARLRGPTHHLPAGRVESPVPRPAIATSSCPARTPSGGHTRPGGASRPPTGPRGGGRSGAGTGRGPAVTGG